MKKLFHERWNSQIYDKIISIFGENWFSEKTVIELGCGQGKIGQKLLELGANVKFTDCRLQHLKNIENDLLFKYNFCPQTEVIDQNKHYELERYDLVLHIAHLYLLENWRQDLQCALQNNNIMILETMVSHIEGFETNLDFGNGPWGNLSSKASLITQESIEKELTAAGCKYLRLDVPELDTNWLWDATGQRIRLTYSWNYDKVKREMYGSKDHPVHPYMEEGIHFRRLWLVLK